MPFSWRVPMWVMESVASSAIYKEKPAAIVTAGSLAVLMFVANSVSASRGTGCWAMLRGPVGDADAQVASSSIVNKKNTAQNPGRMVCGFFFPKEGAFPYSRHIPLLVPHHNHEQAEP